VKILVIGSGATGVHFALSALRKNHAVTMLDVGIQRPSIPLPEENFVGLKQRLDSPVRYFLGEGFEAAILPESNARLEYYNLPAAKDYVFETPKHFRCTTYGITPLVSFATGGLAEAWTGGCYPLNDTELSAFPFGYEDIKPYYGEVARRIGIGGEEDDLAKFFPHHEHLSAPVSLDENSAILLARYERRRNALMAKHNICMGRSRQAVLAKARDGRDGCRYCGRCLWGCPNGALYTPALTLGDCASYANFTYRPGFFASHFHIGSGSLIDHLVAYPVQGGGHERFRADAYVLACGTISTSNLVLRSIYKSTGEIIRLTGLTENRQVLAPFFNLRMLGRSYNPDCYQYHQLAIGMVSEESGQYVHGQITPLKTATVHPIIQSLPLNLRSAVGVFSDLRSGLGVLNLSYCDWRREENYLTLKQTSVHGAGKQWPELSIHYAPPVNEQTPISSTLAKVRRFFFDLGAPILPGMTRMRPMGSSVHYSGTLPMAREKRSWCVSESCQSYDIPNMFVVDGAAMPFLPAKNLTFTLMANAVRVAETAF
jgi:choline dehydrogenase-like flavoprotein